VPIGHGNVFWLVLESHGKLMEIDFHKRVVTLVQNFHLKHASSVLRALPVASTQWCAWSGLLALTLFHAAFLAFARSKILVDLGCFR